MDIFEQRVLNRPMHAGAFGDEFSGRDCDDKVGQASLQSTIDGGRRLI
jgi:hypothetical protein